MKKNTHFFDPALEKLFTGQLTESSIAWHNDSTELRHLFYQLNQSGQEHNILPDAYAFIQHQLQQVESGHTIIPDYSSDKLTALQVTTIPPLAKQFCTQNNIHSCMQQTTAIFLTQPYWLQNTSLAAASQTAISRQLISLFLQLTDKRQQGVALPQAYQAMLLTAGIKIPSLHSHSYSQSPELVTEVLNFATLQLALSRFPRVLLPEILGFTLAYCQSPSIIETCFPAHHIASLFFQQHQSLLQQQIASLQQCISDYLDLFPQQVDTLWQRIQKGFYLHWLQMQRCRQKFNDTFELSSPTQQAVKLLQQKAIAAVGHHQKIQLQGKPLEQWFAGLPENTEAFLQALLQSEYVDMQTPVNSRLLKLFQFNGPMFGVLNKSEQECLLNCLQQGLDLSVTYIDPVQAPLTLQSVRPERKSYTKISNKELYYYLLNVDLFADVLPAAKIKVQKLLHLCTLVNPLPFKHYSHQQFDSYIKSIYQQEISTYKPLQGTPKISKAAYIWGFEQIAPLILIDGSWIQNSLALKDINPEICEILFSIYCDEIGEGQLQQNHPFIFQQLLDSLSIKLPPVYSKEFSEHPGFINSAFDLPVYMLSLSHFSVEFLPELLGLNMAIELSGLGKSYMRLVDDWNYWEIDPTIASIHISIDNYVSGHTFLAKKAIQIYMDDIMQNSANNSAVLDKHWRRIYSGYASLRFVGGRFKFGLPIWYFIHKFKCKYGLGSRL